MAAELITLTAAKLKNLKPRQKTYEVRDQGAPGLRLRVYKTGKITFRWLAKSPQGKNIVHTIGTYPSMQLSEARSYLDKLKAEHVHKLETGEENHTTDKTIKALSQEYLNRRIMKQLRTADDVVALINTLILPEIGKTKLSKLSTVQCRVLIEKIVDRGHSARARAVLARLKHMLDFAVSRGDMTINPAAPLKAEALGIVQNIGNRVLSPSEIRVFFNVLDNHKRLSLQVKLALKILLLTGARTGELLKARWENIDLNNNLWTIPISDQKMKKTAEHRAKPFVIPLTDEVINLFAEAKVLSGDSLFVMASTSATGRLDDKALGHALRRLFKPNIIDPKTGKKVARLEMPKFTPHDLRRTMRTELGKLGIAPHISERCLNHSLGKILETYDHGDYLVERRVALEKWSKQLSAYLAAEDDNHENT